MGNYTIFWMFENPRRGRQARNFTKNVPKIPDLKSSSEQIFSENWRWVPLSYGCKDQLLINKAILEEVRSKRRNLSTTWIDYKKAFDSVPHSWIVKSLELYKMCPTVTRFMRENIKSWKTILHLSQDKGMMTSRPWPSKSKVASIRETRCHL